jgi:hypothetical protein|tara:strand:+ start:309 stop:626 length:318 start_codon:yes stop_codon:yes gene_type:complete
MTYRPLIELDSDDISQIFSKYNIEYDGLENCKGRIYLDSLEIKINSGMCGYETKITLMHEILHAYYDTIHEMRVLDENLIEDEAQYYVENHPEIVSFAMKYLEKE